MKLIWAAVNVFKEFLPYGFVQEHKLLFGFTMKLIWVPVNHLKGILTISFCEITKLLFGFTMKLIWVHIRNFYIFCSIFFLFRFGFCMV